MTAAPYADVCDSCLTADSLPVAPAMAVPDGDGGLIAAYRCPTCGHTWTCGWGLQAGPQPPLLSDGIHLDTSTDPIPPAA